MAVSYIGAASAASNSVNLPTFQAGNLALVVAGNSSSITIPTLPSGWTLINSGNNGVNGVIAGYRFLQSGDTSTGTWTNATHVAVAIYSGPFIPTALIDTQVLSLINAAGGSSSSAAGTYKGTLAGIYIGLGGSSTTYSSSTGSWTERVSPGTRLSVFDTGTPGSSETTTYSASTLLFELTILLREDGGYPIIVDGDTKSGTVTSNSSSWTLTYPTNIAAGDLLLCFIASDGIGAPDASAGSLPAGWVVGGLAGSTAVSGTWAKKLATGSETGNFTATMQASEQGAWIVYRIPAATWYGTLGTRFANADSTDGAVVVNQTNLGGTANPDPTTNDPTNWGSENTLWIAAAMVDTSRTFSAYPSSPDTFTNTGSLVSGGSTGASLGYARLEKNAASVNPGTFTISASDDWVVATVAVRPRQFFNVSAQAMVSIATSSATTYRSYAQSQADIKTTYNIFAQGQTVIKIPWGFAQVQAKIDNPKIHIRKHYFAASDAATTSLNITIEEPLAGSTLILAFISDLSNGTPPTISGGGKTWTAATASYLQDDIEARIYHQTRTTDVSSLTTIQVSWTSSNIDYMINIWELVNATTSPTVSSGTAGLGTSNTEIISVSIPFGVGIPTNRIYLYIAGTTLGDSTYASSTPSPEEVSLYPIEQTNYAFGSSRAFSYIWYPTFGSSTDEIESNEGIDVQISSLGTNTPFALAAIRLDEIHLRNIAQAEAYIGTAAVITHIYAQAQSSIKTIYTAYAQVQADIKQTYLIYAQGQADIKQTYAVNANAGATIKVTIYVCSQAQTALKSTVRSYAQAQTHIKTTSKVVAQSLADIKQTYPFGGGGGTVVVYGDTADGTLDSSVDLDSGTYQDAQDGSNLAVDTTTTVARVGENYESTTIVHISESFLSFDTSSLGAGATISSAVQTLTAYSKSSASPRIDVRSYDWGTSLTTADWVALSGMSGYTLRAHYLTSNGWIQNTSYDLVDDAMVAGINKTGATRFVLSVPGLTDDYIGSYAEFYSADQSGTTQDPKLTIVLSGGTIEGPTFAQAQAQIAVGPVTYKVVAQAQAQIKTTYQVVAQSQTSIKTTYQTYAQAQTSISTIQRSVAQALADIKQTYPLGSGSGGTLVVYSEAADGYIKSLDGTSFPDTGTYADARAGSNLTSDSSSMSGIVGQLYESLFDDINEEFYDKYSVWEGFLSFDTGTPIGDSETVSTAVLRLVSSGEAIDTNFNIEARLHDWGTSLTTADWVAGASLSGKTLLAHYDTTGGWTISTGYDFVSDAMAQNISKTGITRLLLSSSRTTNGNAPNASYDLEYIYFITSEDSGAGTTNDPKLTITLEGIQGPTFAQSQAQISASVATTYKVVAQGLAQIKQTYQVVAQANAQIQTTYRTYAQAQADIKQIYLVVAQGQAQIKTTYRVYAQAQAAIQGKIFAQAQADIRQTYQVYAQAQTQIRTTYRSYAQAQTHIKTTYRVYAQAQSQIKTIYQQVAQAQGAIKDTYRVYAQANADIKQTYQVVAQAQAKIVQTYQVVAQAQTKISTTRVHAQAQAQSKATSVWVAQALAYITGQNFVYAQANADIKQTYAVVAQAQAQIKQTYQVFAQAQTQIKTTYFVYAQAQADIKTTYFVVAQSNATIRATSVVVAQAEASIASVGTSTYAQALAYIYIPQYARPIADISNNAWVRVVI